ncbi:MAG: DUF2723 domain-containing protein [Anaerolineales bacterium]|nr:DUF2723 domain-containing protein [Anaerolineales bacterium]
MNLQNYIVNRERHTLLLPIALFSLVLLFYLASLSPGPNWGDSAEIQRIAATGGIIHYPGYPVYQVLSQLWVRIFRMGSIAWRMNLLSAIFSALTVVGVHHLVVKLTESRPVALLAALVLTVSGSFWSQAVITEVYAFHSFLVVALFVLLLDVGPQRHGRLFLAAYLLGIGLAHHRLILLLLPGVILFLVLRQRHRLLVLNGYHLIAMLLLMLSGFGFYLVTWASVPWGSLSYFMDYVTHSGGELITLSQPFEQLRATVMPRLLHQLGWLGVALSLLGLWALFAQPTRPPARIGASALIGISTLLLFGFLVVNRVAEPEAFASTYQVMSGILFGVGLAYILERLPWLFARRLSPQLSRAVIIVALATLLLFQASASWPRYSLRTNNETEVVSRQILMALPPGASIMAPWHLGQGLRYAQEVGGVRENIGIILDEQTPAERIAGYVEQGAPLYLLGPWYEEATIEAGYATEFVESFGFVSLYKVIHSP